MNSIVNRWPSTTSQNHFLEVKILQFPQKKPISTYYHHYACLMWHILTIRKRALSLEARISSSCFIPSTVITGNIFGGKLNSQFWFRVGVTEMPWRCSLILASIDPCSKSFRFIFSNCFRTSSLKSFELEKYKIREFNKKDRMISYWLYRLVFKLIRWDEWGDYYFLLFSSTT